MFDGMHIRYHIHILIYKVRKAVSWHVAVSVQVDPWGVMYRTVRVTSVCERFRGGR